MRIGTSSKRVILAATSGGKWVLRSVDKSIHPSAWKGRSQGFALTGFSEVRGRSHGMWPPGRCATVAASVAFGTP